jgi:predicted nucleic acid-binding Zn finger protein
MGIQEVMARVRGVRIWRVRGTGGQYYVQRRRRAFWCNCADFFFRRQPKRRSCKHVKAVRERLGMGQPRM